MDNKETRINEAKEIVRDIFATFKVDAEIVDASYSPLSIILEIHPGQGTKFSELYNLTKETGIAFGKNVKYFQSDEASSNCYLTIPHDIIEETYLNQIIDSDQFNKSNSKLLIAAGIAENGAPIFVDFDQSPHILITGTTGSGKTVFLDDIIISLISKNTPDEVRLVLIDPTNTDFSIYNNLPHLLCPVLSNKGEINDILSMMSDLITKRYDILSEEGIRYYKDYNEIRNDQITPIVILIDKYVKVYTEMPKDFENSLNKIVSQGRAVGVHLVINTQTASSEILSGTIKNNMLTKITFSLASGSESRMAMDRTGAEKLTVPGEVFIDRGAKCPYIHARASYVTYPEIKEIVNNTIKLYGKNNFINEFSSIHKKYTITEDVQFISKVLHYLTINAKTNAEKLHKEFSISMSESYEVIDFLEENGFIEPIIGNFHNSDYDIIMDALKLLDSKTTTEKTHG